MEGGAEAAVGVSGGEKEGLGRGETLGQGRGNGGEETVLVGDSVGVKVLLWDRWRGW